MPTARRPPTPRLLWYQWRTTLLLPPMSSPVPVRPQAVPRPTTPATAPTARARHRRERAVQLRTPAMRRAMRASGTCHACVAIGASCESHYLCWSASACLRRLVRLYAHVRTPVNVGAKLTCRLCLQGVRTRKASRWTPLPPRAHLFLLIPSMFAPGANVPKEDDPPTMAWRREKEIAARCVCG